MVLDEIKSNSDDSYVTEDHVRFLVDKYRAFILKQKYSDIKKQIPESNYQTICLDLEEVDAIDKYPCGRTYLRSIKEIPVLLPIGNTQVYPMDYYQGEITYVSREKMKYVGFNKYMKNIIYCSLAPNNHLYFKSNNAQHKYLERVKITGIFEDSNKADELSIDNDDKCNCNPLDRTVALEDALVPVVIEMIVKELLGVKYQPRDTMNDAAPLPNTTNNNESRR